MGRTTIRNFMLVAALAVSATSVYPQADKAPDDEAKRKASEKFLADLKRESENRQKLPRDDEDMSRGLARGHPRPQSAWRSSEKALYQSLLSKGKFETLVVPFQVQRLAFARDIRSLMAAELAMAIGETTKASVADPYLVARALGDGERRLNQAEIFQLANAVGARRIVAGYVGHDDNGKMRITLQLYERNDGESFSEYVFGVQRDRYGNPMGSDRLRSRHFDDITFSDQTTPLEAYEAMLPEMLKFLGMTPALLGTANPVSRLKAGDLPASPLVLRNDAAEPARDAYYLQLMAALTPVWAERTRERLIEKSMLALLRMSPQSPEYRALKARALMNMGLRPAALRMLGTPASAEEKHLHAVLNGNLPAVRANRAAVPAGVKALTALLEENAIAAEYDLEKKEARHTDVAALKLPGDTWTYLVRRALTDADLWTPHRNIELKVLLDRELPIEGLTAEAMLRGAAAVGNLEQAQDAADLSVFEHVRKYFERTDARSCCEPLTARFTTMDFVDLADAISTNNLSRRAMFLAVTQGNPDGAIQYLAKLESTYKDHPHFVLARARAELALARSASPARRDGLLKSAYVDAYNVWYWEQGQTHAAARAFIDVITETRRQDYGFADNVYANDYPFRPYYTFWQLGNQHERNARRALENSSFDIYPLTYLEWWLGRVQKRWDKVDELLKSIDGRFKGEPELVKFMAQSALRRDDIRAGERYYTEAIQLQPDVQDLYSDLGKLLFENGAGDKAAKVFMSYPGLKDGSANPVHLSNYAFAAGSLYYWSGDFKHAVPLYKVAAELETGSDASLSSAIRLALLDGDYPEALRGSLARAQRYESPYAYRDYLGLLHAMGASKEAWQGFMSLVRQIDKPQVWESALVGHRLEGASEAAIAAWAAQEPIRTAGRDYAYSAMYMLRAGVTDRTPSTELPARIAALERAVWQLDNEWHSVARPNADGSAQLSLGPDSPSEGVTLAMPLFDTNAKAKVKSELVYYAEAYAAVRAGKFENARMALERAATLYDMRKTSLGYLLPLYAYAAARARNTDAVEKTLAKFSVQYQRFDYHLAKAVISALAGKRDQSLEHLKLALVRRPYTDQRPIYTEYQYAEICEWLFDTTRDARYRNLALDWAKKNEAFQPWMAWPYALEARLNQNAAERARAIAMAHYLDPKSERLSALSQAELAAALKEYANRNPFRQLAAPRQKVPI